MDWISSLLLVGLVASAAALIASFFVPNKISWKLALTALSLFGGLAAIWPPESKLKLGIDLSGGTILVYEVREDSMSKNFRMEDLITALKRRVNPDGSKDIPIRPLGNNRVEIVLPLSSGKEIDQVEEVDQLKRKLTTQGFLEFRILASQKHDGPAIQRALRPENAANPPEGFKWVKLGETVTGPTDPAKIQFTETTLTDQGRRWISNKYAGSTVVVTGTDSANLESIRNYTIAKNSENTLTLEPAKGAKPLNFKSIKRYQIEFNPSDQGRGPTENSPFGLRDVPKGDGVVERQVLARVPNPRMDVTGDDLNPAGIRQEESQMRPAVAFAMNPRGAQKFGRLTGAHLPEVDGFKYYLAIILDGIVQSAPVINDQIRDSGQITMGKTGPELMKEVDFLIKILKAGSLPGSLNPTPLQEEQIGPTLGKDTITKGLNAIGISLLVVPIFMILYYRLAGAIAVFALVLNTILLLGSMALLEASFTLPGLAGFALTIGMAVDANVLIFERMREEAERGANMATQIRNGFNRAWVTILDSHVTMFLSGAVLYFVGTEEVKGFAVTMIVGMIWNLFTAVFITRVIFEILQKRGLRSLTMYKLFDKTNINFTGPRYYCMAVSAVLILIGLAGFGLRGGFSSRGDIYNIDFTGGTLVTIHLDPTSKTIEGLSESARASYVRETASTVLPDSTVESLAVATDKERGVRFNIRTTEQDMKTVQEDIRKAFGDTLNRVEFQVSEGRPIPKATDATPALPGTFPGGREYTLTFNSNQPPSRIATEFSLVLEAAKVDAPRDHFAVVSTSPGGAESGDAGTKSLVLRTDLEPEQADALIKELSVVLKNDPSLLFEHVENFGAAVAGESRNLAFIAIVASWLIIIGYLWFRFKSVAYGLAAVIALVHDVLVALGAVALSKWFLPPGYKIDLPMVAAFLTLIGFSVNDTIVIFDRIRELKGKSPLLSDDLVNLAVNQTLSRTILTTFTAFLVVVILYIFGGEGLAPFSFCLLVGFISGTYSTVYIASPILLDWAARETTAPAGAKDSLVKMS